MKPFLGFLTITIISAFCGMVTGLVLIALTPRNLILWSMLQSYVGAPVGAIVGAFISARFTYGILVKVSYFELSGPNPEEWLGDGFVMASILALIGGVAVVVRCEGVTAYGFCSMFN